MVWAAARIEPWPWAVSLLLSTGHCLYGFSGRSFDCIDENVVKKFSSLEERLMKNIMMNGRLGELAFM